MIDKKNRYDKVFYAEIKRMNDANEAGTSKIIQVSANEAMLMYWCRMSWQYDIYPFRAL